jgi:transposase, IS30 family
MAFDDVDAAELKARFLARLDVVGNVTAVAREMGLNPNTAYGWARKACFSFTLRGYRA